MTLTGVSLALIGGMLIGLSASGMLLALGRVTGVSGILSGFLFPKKTDWLWRALFILGLLTGGLTLKILGFPAFPTESVRSPLAIAIGGWIVGFGTLMGSGCTSGHGICGISRLSIRSILATVCFIGAGMVTVTVIRVFFGGQI